MSKKFAKLTIVSLPLFFAFDSTFADTVKTDQWVVVDRAYYDPKTDGKEIKQKVDADTMKEIAAEKAQRDAINNGDYTWNATPEKNTDWTLKSWEATKNEATKAGASTDGKAPASADAWADSGPLEIEVTERPFWMDDCQSIGGTSADTKKYKCTVRGTFATVMGFITGLIKYATFLTALVGVLMIVYSGLMIVATAGSDKERAAAKARIASLIGGLVLLFLIAFILNTVAPWIYK